MKVEGEVKIQTEPYPNRKYETFVYELRNDGWYVRDPYKSEHGYVKYASKRATERDLQQLIRKEYDCRY